MMKPWRAKDDAEAATPAHPSPLDGEVLDELREVMEDDFFRAIGAFLHDTPRRLETLQQAAARGDAEALLGAAHALQGNSGNLGAMVLSDLCQDVVHSCRSASLTDAVQQVAHIEAEYARVQAALEQILQEQVG